MDISNKFLAILLVIAIVITLIGALYSVDKLSKLGFISGTDVFGYVNITISNQTTINVTATNCNFGTGYVTAPNAYATLAPGTEGFGIYCEETDKMENWTNTTVYDPACMEVRNDGNIGLKINLSSGKTTDTFIGGNSATNEYNAWSNDKESSACVTGEQNYPGLEMDTTNKTMCSCLLPDNSTDEIYVGCELVIPDDAWGTKGDVWTFWAEPAAGGDCVA